MLMKIKLNLKSVAAMLAAALLVGPTFANEGQVPKGVPHLDHVFIIMMENHGYHQILNNPNAPFINQLAKSANLAKNYFAVGHPSLTSYLEVVGGSNFGVRSDNYPDWHSSAPCQTNLFLKTVATDNPPSLLICPIAGSGQDAETPAIDCTNEVQTTPPNCYYDIDGILSIPAVPNTIGKTIADQLVEKGRRWKTYEESLPPGGADLVNISDGHFTNNTDFTPYIAAPTSFSSWTIQKTKIPAITTQAQAQGDIGYLYAVKHNPFVYFQSVQEGTEHNSLHNVHGFDGPEGLYADLASGDVADFSFIAPNPCNDQHGRGNAGPFCNYDAVDNGTQWGLNGALIYRGDVAVQQIVSAIKKSEAWRDGNNAIIVMWDENDYMATPNQVMLIVDTDYGKKGVQSTSFYTHFSLLK
jgi:hypothetical protein